MRKQRWGAAGGLGVGILTALLSACGGGSGGSRTTSAPEVGQLQLNVRVAANSTDGDWTVCLDANQNLVCDGDEPVASLATEDYQLTLPAATSLADRYWVAERQLPAGTAVMRLAAPAGSTVVSSLSTLVTAQLLNAPQAGLAGAQQEVVRLLGLPAGTDLLAAPGAREDGAVGLAADTAMAALLAGAQARAGRSDSLRVATASPADTAARASLIPQVVLGVLANYTDPDEGSLLPTVSARTIASETAEALNPTQCSMAEPLRLRIDTDEAAPITSKETYVKARLRTEASALYGEALDLETSIRGRGNSTWTLPKKPYKLKLSKATSLLGMSADKEWALLANYADKSLLRNAVAFCLSSTLGLSYTPDYRYVELELNGQYQGVYQLVEHIKTSADRVDIGSAAPAGDDPGGFLLEIDARLDADAWFISERAQVPYVFKSEATATQIPQVQALIKTFEEALFGDAFLTRGPGGYLPLLDTESLVDFYLINELLRNNDSFFSSTFVTRKDDGPLVFGPVWDFDIAAGNINYNGNESPTGWYLRSPDAPTYNGYLLQLFKDPSFERHVVARWKFLSRRMPALQRFIRQSASTLDAAQQRNFQTWDILNTWVWPNAVVTGSYEGEVAYLSAWLQQRGAWMDQQLGTSTAR